MARTARLGRSAAAVCAGSRGVRSRHVSEDEAMTELLMPRVEASAEDSTIGTSVVPLSSR